MEYKSRNRQNFEISFEREKITERVRIYALDDYNVIKIPFVSSRKISKGQSQEIRDFENMGEYIDDLGVTLTKLKSPISYDNFCDKYINNQQIIR